MASKKQYTLQSLKKSSKKLYGKYRKKIVDILLFGSFLKGKHEPSDIDLCVIFKGVDLKEVEDFYKDFKVEFGPDAHYNWLLAEDLIGASLFPTLIEEGHSLLEGKFLHKKLGYKSGVIFSYKITGLSSTEKVKFSYALHGHNEQEGLVKEIGAMHLGKGVLFVPLEHSDEFREFLDYWKADYMAKKVLMS